MKQLLVLFSALPVLACGANPGSGPDGGNTPGTYRVSGAATETGTCAASAAYSSSDQTLAFSLTGGDSVSFVAQLPGTALSTGRFDTTIVITGALDYTRAAQGAVWLASVNTEGQADQGTFALTLSDTGPTLTSGDGAAWTSAHGTLDGTLPALSGSAAAGVVTFQATF